jgi:FixJ family two-component response regulator
MNIENGYVAVVDDDASVVKALSRLLRSYGLKTAAFTSGEEFIRFAIFHRFDSIVLDIHMPGLDGFQVQDRLESMGIRAPIVFITALGDPGIQAKAAARGAAGYLQKPFSDKALLDGVRGSMRDCDKN